MDGFLIGRVRGIELRLNWSVFVIAVLVTWSLAESVLPEFAEGRSDTQYWLTAAIMAIAFFSALIAHEMGHAVVAVREGVEVKGITLWLFGGVAQLGSEPETPKAAFRVAVAGPLVSAALGVLGLVIAIAFDGLAQVAILWFSLMNIALLVFNLLPAFPLDGGRIYQAWQWHRTGDAAAATAQAATVGLVVGAVLVGLGFLQAFFGQYVGGIWLMLIGWFLREAARAEWRHSAVEGPLSVLTVRQVMSRDPITVADHVTVHGFVAGLFFQGRHAAYPVTSESGEVTGLITIKALRGVAPEDAGLRTVGQLATPLAEVIVVSPSAPVATLLHELNTANDTRALVFEEEQLVGIVSPSDVARLVSVVELASPSGGRFERP